MQDAKLYAFQFVGGAPPAGDFDGNNFVDWKDLGAFVDHWLERCRINQWCAGRDIDRNGSVNGVDFALFAIDWLVEQDP
jgi:hypothetical protein